VEQLILSRSGTEVASATKADWNIDPMDGSGPSGVTIDWDKVQIMMIDFEWLGAGRVRVGFVVDGMIYYAHEFLNANNETAVYMSSPNHSLRYEIRGINTGATLKTNSLVQICGSVNAEGGLQDVGVIHSASTEGTHIDATTENTEYAVLGLRLNPTNVNTTVQMIGAQLQMQTANHLAEWSVYYNPTVAGTFGYSSIANSSVQYAKGATANTVSGGTKVWAGYIESGSPSQGASGSAAAELNNALRLGCSIDGVPTSMVLVVRPVGGSSAIDVEGAFVWREL